MPWTADRIRAHVWERNWTSDFGEDFHAACVLLASLVVGPNADRIAKFLERPREEVRTLAVRLRKNGVWRGQKVCCNWFDEKLGGIAFCCDVNVAIGLMECRT